MNATVAPARNNARRTAWISQGLEELLGDEQQQRSKHDKDAHFDVVIIGSGYGGAIAAASLAGCTEQGEPISVCVLERGREYLDGMFPSSLAELPVHVRFSTPSSRQAQGRSTGLFDVRAGGDVNALVANGLGGGSLINAGVMATPEPEVFTKRRADAPTISSSRERERTSTAYAISTSDDATPAEESWYWPPLFRDDAQREGLYKATREFLGVPEKGTKLTTADGDVLPKYAVLEALSKSGAQLGARLKPAALATLTAPAAPGEPGPCLRCGDCATGCNYGAKNSLDRNLLARARANGAQIYAGATVLRIQRVARVKPRSFDDPTPRDLWCLLVVHTDAKLRVRQGAPFKLYTRRVILAAGTFGSTEILLRSNDTNLGFSPRLGRGFSGNGDTIAALYNHRLVANAVADETRAARDRQVGPTITGMLSLRSETGRRILIEELAIPGSLKRMFEEVVSTANVLHTLDQPDKKTHSRADADPCAVDSEAISRTSLFALMGDDDADGTIELVGGAAESDGDGAVRVRWPKISTHELFDDQLAVLEQLANPKDRKKAATAVGGRVLPNPLWRFVPRSLEELFDDRRGPAFTVHPLGGCAVGANCHRGVVDEYGRVFRDDEGVWEGLVVLDGSIVPTALGTNPALTIAALALRGVSKMRTEWGLSETKAEPPPPKPRLFRTPQHPLPAPTMFELVERLRGDAMLQIENGSTEECTVELTLRFKAFPVTNITGVHKSTLELDSAQSFLRIFGAKEWHDAHRRGDSEKKIEQLARVTASLEGALAVFCREKSDVRKRRRRALRAWLQNRGVRDTWQWLRKLSQAGKADLGPAEYESDDPWHVRYVCRFLNRLGRRGRTAARKLVNARALASHAGETRLLDYDLKIRDVGYCKPDWRVTGLVPDKAIKGKKRLTYGRRANPWRQLMEVELEQFPGANEAEPPSLELDLRYLGERQVPLLRIIEQQNQVTALADLIAFLAYLLRLMIMVHVWSFRRPDAADPREPQRLPGRLRAFLRRYTPLIKELEVDKSKDGTPVHVRLTRYQPLWPWKPRGLPLVMIHGYSASGTTFAHDAVRPNLATYFLGFRQRREVWVLDLRTSSGMPTARLPWRFEDAALEDIPAALEYILRDKAEKKVDVIAHCMGSAMFSMAVLAPPKAGAKFAAERSKLPQWINRAVLSQVGPLVEFSAANVLRGHVLSYIRYFLPLERYEFRVGPDPSLTDQLIDRFLATLPYPEEEFDLENPLFRRTRWVGTRHRMDALYARDFSLKNIPRRVLKYIDDLFGPLSIETVSQGIHFARHNVITNHDGRNEYVSRRQLNKRWTFPTLSVHGMENGLADIATLGRMHTGFEEAATRYQLETEPFRAFGHQDSLIGRDARRVFKAMAKFLDPARAPRERLQDAPQPRASMPWLGPHIGPLEPGQTVGTDVLPVRAAARPGPGRVDFAVFLPVKEVDGRFVPGRGNGEFAPCACESAADWSAVRVPAVALDEDQWLRLDLVVSREWIEGAAGILMFLIDDEPERQKGAFPKYDVLREARRNRPFTLANSADELFADMSFSPEESAAIETYLLGVRRAIDDELKKPADELRSALIEVPTPPQRLCFVLGSCQYPAGLLDATVADRSMELLAERLDEKKTPRPNLLLLVGDQVYVDATAGLFDPTAVNDRYVRSYERLYERPAVQSVLRRLPSFTMLDDHEIEDNWEPGEREVRTDERVNNGRRSYWRYQRFDRFDDPERELSCDLSRTFESAGYPFFLLDTRTRREQRTATTVRTARIIPDEEFVRLRSWLEEWHGKAPERPKFIACPAIPLPRHLRTIGASGAGKLGGAAALRSDGWDGYPRSLAALLAYIALRRIRNVVFLSGDEHLTCIAKATLRAPARDPVTVFSIHCSAMYAPFPFANADVADFPDEDEFEMQPNPADLPFSAELDQLYGLRCSCAVEIVKGPPPGDGFAIVRVSDSRALSLEFVRRDRVWKNELRLE